ncbi:hypothetical protein L873DRAFT_1811697 [Choiromyces venosus 120613-1]|uniref:Uncharacterized protein n=1 Tax=Choiromyces venosus 120613-1 TaxID=1336337 RepID=A0A3N4JHV8_9PEZI|nr:hypothetical protein L873DRAFT_1811697 [Choiromyces venosus 120613-1]
MEVTFSRLFAPRLPAAPQLSAKGYDSVACWVVVVVGLDCIEASIKQIYSTTQLNSRNLDTPSPTVNKCNAR